MMTTNDLPIKLSRLVPWEELEAALAAAGLAVVGRTATEGGTIARIPAYLDSRLTDVGRPSVDEGMIDPT